MQEEDTIVSLATPSQQSALGIIRISGNKCKSLCKDIFGLSSPTPRKVLLKHYKSVSNDYIDQVTFVMYINGKSFTGEDMIEITFHGNMLIAEQILEDLIKRKCRLAEPGEYSKRAFLNGKIDLTQAESIADLISAKSEIQLKVSKKQLAGSIKRILLDLQDKIICLQSQIEAFVDFPEDDINDPNFSELNRDIEFIINNISKLSQSHSLRKEIYQTIKISLVGPPNAGKSSIFNKLLSEDRSIVTDIPGTTRDYLSKQIVIDGHLIELFDTAGIRDCPNQIEKIGIENTLNVIEQSNIVLLVFDQSIPYPIDFVEKIMTYEKENNFILINNKSDLDSSNLLPLPFPVYTSIKSSIYDENCVGSIFDKIKSFIKENIINSPVQDIIVNKRQYNHLNQALIHMRETQNLIQLNEQEEFILQELQLGLVSLNHVVGITTNEDMLDKLFSNFCIGK